MLTGKYKRYDSLLNPKSCSFNREALSDEELSLSLIRPREGDRMVDAKTLSILKIGFLFFLTYDFGSNILDYFNRYEMPILIVLFYEFLFFETKTRENTLDYLFELNKWEDRVRYMVDKRGY